ncbi:uncharacterized protein PAC_11856 [Phialocephala subalpina]|uniref:Uncharacterized protein n=1 Tax=Phialocephala subalpina TaxID=576137 RepID=A0A1L7XAB2_9HELO|nr:uncharacterized protein PAC_11856 [Phialocephala subalpina]
MRPRAGSSLYKTIIEESNIYTLLSLIKWIMSTLTSIDRTLTLDPKDVLPLMSTQLVIASDNDPVFLQRRPWDHDLKIYQDDPTLKTNDSRPGSRTQLRSTLGKETSIPFGDTGQ